MNCNYRKAKEVEFDLFKNKYFTTGEFQEYVIRLKGGRG
jgi:hypothetical protein